MYLPVTKSPKRRCDPTKVLVRERIFARRRDGAAAEWTLEGGFRAWHGEVTLGLGGDRFCPDTWSGQRRILLYSEHGCDRVWTLPTDWSDVPHVILYPLTPENRGQGMPVAIKDRTIRPVLLPQVP